MIGGTRTNKSSKPRGGKTENNCEDTSHIQSMEQERKTSERDVTIDDNSVSGSTISRPTVYVPCDAPVNL